MDCSPVLVFVIPFVGDVEPFFGEGATSDRLAVGEAAAKLNEAR
jgi:hypothetical protein